MTDIFLRAGDATPTTIVLRDPTQSDAGGVDHPATIAVTLDDVAVTSSGTVGHPGTIAATLEGVSVTSSGTVNHPATIAVTLEDVAPSLNGATGRPGTVAVTLGDIATTSSGAVGHPANVEVSLDGVAIQLTGSTVSAEPAGGAHYGQYGAIDFWLLPLEKEKEEEKPLPKKAAQIIKRVAKEEAEKDKPFKLAPLREAFQAVSYPFKSDYYELYRQAYKAELNRLRQEEEDEDDAVLMLM